MPPDLRSALLLALRAQAGAGPHAELAKRVVFAVLLAQLLAGADHDGPPHVARRPPRHIRATPRGRPHRESLAGRRPRG